MANYCCNSFYAYSTDKENLNTIRDYFIDNYYISVCISSEEIELEFNSKWVFPKDAMDELLELLPNKKDIFMRCLSVEYGNDYHALWKCYGKEWIEV